jgi:hypothetical protein
MLSVAAVALGAAALLAALRDDDGERGRLVQTRLVPSESGPVLFPLDEFYASTGEDGQLRALYIYPPGFYGHTRGCPVVWAADAEGSPSADGPGAFLDPCGGARFARDGTLIEGDAPRGLDRFKTEPGIEGIIVDTRTLYCGEPYAPQPAASPTAIATTALPVLTPGLPQTIEPSPTATTTPAATSTAQVETFDECDRVSADAD